MTTGVDVSHYQSAHQVDEAVAAGAEFVIIKATQGLTQTDPEHAAYVHQTRVLGKTVGHYHFAQNVGAAVAEADHFLHNALPHPGDLVALDLEQMDGTWEQRVSYAVRWLGHVETVLGVLPWRYMNKDWLSHLTDAASMIQRGALNRYPLWIATGGDTPGEPKGVLGWTCHQYSTAGSIDHDVLARGVNLADLTIPGGTDDMPLTQADANLIATTLANSTVFLNKVAQYVWNGAGGAPVGTPSYQNQMKTIVHNEVQAGPTGGSGSVDSATVEAAVLTALTQHPLRPQV